jgi:hypothetical protein
MSLLFLPEIYGGADTCVLGKGWEVLSMHGKCDHETAVKKIFQLLGLLMLQTYQEDNLFCFLSMKASKTKQHTILYCQNFNSENLENH